MARLPWVAPAEARQGAALRGSLFGPVVAGQVPPVRNSTLVPPGVLGGFLESAMASAGLDALQGWAGGLGLARGGASMGSSLRVGL